jgi:hypothetical protein
MSQSRRGYCLRAAGHIAVWPKIRDEKLWDSKKPRFLMKMSPIYF